MKDFIKEWGRVCLGSVAAAGLGAASFFAVEALIPQAADASRRVVDVTDAQTKAFCKANPDQCKTSIRWDITIGWFLILLVGPFAWKCLNQTLLGGIHRSYATAKAKKPFEHD